MNMLDDLGTEAAGALKIAEGVASPYVFWIKLAGAIALIGSIFGAGVWFEAGRKDRVIAEMQLEQARGDAAAYKGALDQFAADADKIHGAAGQFANLQTDLHNHFTAFSKDLQNAIKAKPLPPGCFPTPERLRPLSAAVAEANAARTIGHITVPAVPGTP